jgi:hypothetical protein
MDLNFLEERLARAKAALREAKKKEKLDQEKKLFELVKKSGLTLAQLEKIIADSGVSVIKQETAKPGVTNE